ncbi:PREDICTED: uncharacterized protein LOC105557240 [Vollenhovia emeryi]|uniref:uncharacterized protein LOC105557240 n=1 Tax=Vollenhovia emeryi TaxID=411798 RepID=UPI0005F38F6F|nr:PREDICTED: uncharacterized protein LOC105557240 [Vollenhovia emeryi]
MTHTAAPARARLKARSHDRITRDATPRPPASGTTPHIPAHDSAAPTSTKGQRPPHPAATQTSRTDSASTEAPGRPPPATKAMRHATRPGDGDGHAAHGDRRPPDRDTHDNARAPRKRVPKNTAATIPPSEGPRTERPSATKTIHNGGGADRSDTTAHHHATKK